MSNQLKVTPGMIDNAEDRKSIGILQMDAYQFLRLTIDSSTVTTWMDEEIETTKSLDQYNAWGQDGTIRVMPFLNIDMRTGKVLGHEGRHRAASILNSGGKFIPVAIFLKKDYYTVNRIDGRPLGEEDIPKTLIGEFRPSAVQIDHYKFQPFKVPAYASNIWLPRSKYKMSVGALIYARDTGKFLLGKRGPDIEDPNVWGTFGGGVDHGESLHGALARELKEEAGYEGPMHVHPLYTYHDQSTGFRYFNNLGVVPKQFVPHLNFETSEAEWFEWPGHPRPLHPGVKSLFDDPASQVVIESAAYGKGRLKGTA